MRGPLAPAHAAADLVGLGEAEQVGAVDDQRVRLRDVEAGLDDRRRAEHVVVATQELEHDLLELAVAHLAVGDADPHLGHQAAQLLGRLVDRLDAVVEEERLPAAIVLAADRDRAPAPRPTPPRACGSACDRRAASRSRRCRAGPRATCAACAGSASPTARARRPRAAARAAAPSGPRRSAAPRRRSRARASSARRRARARDACRSARRPCPRRSPESDALTSPALRMRETSSMRSGKSRKRSRKVCRCCWASTVVGASTSTWRPALATLNARAQRDLGLAEADVAADQPIHRPLRLEVVLDGLDRARLILGLGVREGRLEPRHPALVADVRLARVRSGAARTARAARRRARAPRRARGS